MLTVRYGQLGLVRGERLLDLGCGGGRHAFGAIERGARVVALDVDLAELKDVRRWFDALAAESPPGSGGCGAVLGADALHLPFPDGAFDRVIAAEVLEHVCDDAGALAELARVLRPGGSLAVTVPAWLSERVCWALADDYHAPAVAGGHVRVYTRAGVRRRLVAAGLVTTGAHGAHALHTPYWWLRCLVGPSNDSHPLVKAYHRLLVWDIVRSPLVTRAADALLRPLLAKSLVVYAAKPARPVLSPAGSAR